MKKPPCDDPKQTIAIQSRDSNLVLSLDLSFPLVSCSFARYGIGFSHIQLKSLLCQFFGL